uniref:Uncharacterized protein n=1 Tax=Arion vulgaris TaxID=1028688 RepID=A0A0B6ZCT6_9EUPU
MSNYQQTPISKVFNDMRLSSQRCLMTSNVHVRDRKRERETPMSKISCALKAPIRKVFMDMRYPSLRSLITSEAYVYDDRLPEIPTLQMINNSMLTPLRL